MLFSTYTSLIAEEKKKKGQSKKKTTTRFDQIAAWFGRGAGPDGKRGDYDGVIIFDEAHKAKSGMKKGKLASRTGQVVIQLQEICVNARVIYVSATPASKPNELCYMQRCGYWGNSSLAWDTFQDFDRALEKRGMAAMGK